MCHEQSRLLLRLCDMGLTVAWLPTVLGPMASPATLVVGIIWRRLESASGASPGAFAGITSGTSSRTGLSVVARPGWLAALAAASHGRGLPPPPVTMAGIPLLPSEEELSASGDGPR